ncbi:YdcH family protein [Nocardia jejuensis]|uniref:YdcH family protein n=1 Tax=Nocardia jejuensis TaxID=328049 RepID=UPI00082BD3F3|nr:DUF465 domain-containing protein [Nocardia jejuensis]
MSAKHNLLADLNITAEELATAEQSDARLNALHEKYNEIDRQVVEVEAGYADEEELTALRKQRLAVKDEIVAHLNP